MTPAMIRTGASLAALCLATVTAQAAVVVSNLPNQGYGTNMSFALVADDFTLSSQQDVTGLRFWTLQSAPSDYAGSVYWAIYSDSAGPSSVLFSGTANPTGATTGNTGFGYREFVYDINVTFQLAAGNYWLALQNDSLGSTNATEMIWGTSETGGDAGRYQDFQLGPNPPWLGTDFNHAFAILADDGGPPNPTPEPASLGLLAAGLLALRAVRRPTRAA